MNSNDADLAPRKDVPRPTPKGNSLNSSFQSSLDFLSQLDAVVATVNCIQQQVREVLPADLKLEYPLLRKKQQGFKEITELLCQQFQWLLANKLVGLS